MRRRRRTISLAAALAAAAVTFTLAGPASAASPSTPTPTPHVTSPSAGDRDDTLPYAPRTTPPATPLATRPLLRSALPDGLSAQATATSTTVHQLDIVVATPSGQASTVTDPDVDSLVADVSSYWSGQTNGRVSFQVKTIERVTAAAGCSTDTGITKLWSQGSKAVAGKDWWDGGDPDAGPPAREHLVVLYPYAKGDADGETTCGGTLGLGTTPTSASVTQNGLTFALFGAPDAPATNHDAAPQFYESRQSLAHELGHNFGLQHSGFWWCDQGPSDGAFTSSSCGMVSYWDPLDLMGAGFGDKGIPPLSSPQKLRLGLLTAAQHRTLSATTSAVTLAAVPATEVGAPASPQVVQVTDPATGSVYDVEYRPSMPGVTFPAGSPFDTYTVDGFGRYRIGFGVRILRLAPHDTDGWAKNEQSVVPIGSATSRTSYLAAGHTFTTRSGKLSFKLTTTHAATSSSPATATLAVVVHKTPSLSLSRSAASQRHAQTAARMAARVGSVDGRHATGIVAFRDGSRTLHTVRTSSTGIAVYTLPRSLSVRSHTITAVFTPDAASKARGVDATSRHTTVKVTKASSSVGVKLAHTTLTKGARTKATVHVTVKGVVRPTGTVRIYENGHKVATTKIAASKKGTVTLTLPRTTKRGTVKVVAKYSGTSSIASRTSRAVTLRVR